MKVIEACAGYAAYDLQPAVSPNNACSLKFRFDRGDVILCKSSGFAPWPEPALLEGLSAEQEKTLLNGQPIRVGAGQQGVELTLFHHNVIEARAGSGRGIEFTPAEPFRLPLRLQLWIYDRERVCAVAGTADSRAEMPAPVSYQIHEHLFGKRTLKIQMQAPVNFPDGFLSYVVNDLEYPIPNRLLGQDIPLSVSGEPKLQGTGPWQGLFRVHRA